MDVSNSETIVPNTLYQNIVDLTKLEQISLDEVLECLIKRFASNNFHTFAGSVLISLNPCFKSKAGDERKSIGVNPLSEGVTDFKAPHIYSIGDKCLNNLYVNGNQIVVVSGDSGAGKTTATQQLLCYFIEKNHELNKLRAPTTNRNSLEKKIYCATLILEGLGNACTKQNPNSSRFGRLVQLNYNNISGVETIIGAQIDTCLLEKYRVSKFGHERNFHIFYYVLVAMQKNLFDMSFLDSSVDDPLSLIPPYFQEALRKADFDDFDAFWKSIVTLNMTSEIQHVFQIIYGIMMLLNIKFISASNNHSGHKNSMLSSSGEIENDEKENRPVNENTPLKTEASVKDTSSYSFFGQRGKGFAIQNADSLEPLEEIFEVDLYALLDAILSRNITAGRRKSTVRKPCETIAECQQRLFSLVSTIYDSLFTFILHRLNSFLEISDQHEPSFEHVVIASKVNEHSTTKTLSLLDLYGFESNKTNHLEQLCINYANERLQQVHISHLKSFMCQSSSGMSTSPCTLDQVQQELSTRLYELHSTVFTVLNEACMLNRPQADNQTYNCLRGSVKNSCFIRVKKVQDQNCPFVVKHYAGEVEYHLKGMLDKNRDYIPPEFLDLLQSSSSATIKCMFTSADEEAKLTRSDKGRNVNNKAKREKTILQRFKTSVEKLIDQLEVKNDEHQDVQFIRCIRPNNDLIKGNIDRELIKKQLYAIGIVDLIRISANGYPIRIPIVKFFQKLRLIILRCFSSHGSSVEQGKFRASFNFNKSELRFGVSHVFMTEKTWQFFLQLEQRILERFVLKCQRTWRAIQRRRAEKAVEKQQTIHLIEEMLKIKPPSKVDDIESDFFEDAVEFQFLATSTPARTGNHHRSLTDLRKTMTAFESTSHEAISGFHRNLENFHATPNPIEESAIRHRRKAKLHAIKSGRSKSSDSKCANSCYPGPQGDASHLVFLDPHDPTLFHIKEKSKCQEVQQKTIEDDKDCCQSEDFDSGFWQTFRHSATKLFVSEDRSIISRRCIYKISKRWKLGRALSRIRWLTPAKGLGLAEILDS